MKVDGSDMQQKTAMTEKRQPQTLQDWVVRMSGQIKNALPASITPERMTRIALTALNTNQQLARCSRDSFLGALLTAAQLGLEINTPLGQAYLIPYGNKAQFQLGYQGLIELCYRTGQYKRIVARVVYDGDFFEYEYGLNERLAHKPANKSKQPVAVYGLYELKNGAAAFEVMIASPAVRNAIRENKTAQLKSLIQTGTRDGMQSMESALAALAVQGRISRDDAARCSCDRSEFFRLLNDGTARR